MTKKEPIPVMEAIEGNPVSYVTNASVEDNIKLCKHVTEEGHLPCGIQAINEGGYNSTLICLDCLLEWGENSRLSTSKLWCAKCQAFREIEYGCCLICGGNDLRD